MTMQLPDGRPEDDPQALWRLQNELLILAESLLGPRDSAKKIYQPNFDSDGPHIRNTPNLDGAFAELSPNAAGYWPTVVYEMGHETVHLLNPDLSGANFLEEGMAVEFSLRAMEYYSLPIQQIRDKSYAEALGLVRQLSPNVFAAGKLIRKTIGRLRDADAEVLQRLFPESDHVLLCRLCQPFPLR